MESRAPRYHPTTDFIHCRARVALVGCILNRIRESQMEIPAKMRIKSRTSAERQRGKPDGTGSGKDLGNFTGFAHSKISAHFHAALSRYSTATYDPIAAFLPSRLFVWIPQVAKYWFRKKHAFRDYTTLGKGTGIYPIDDRVKK